MTTCLRNCDSIYARIDAHLVKAAIVNELMKRRTQIAGTYRRGRSDRIINI